MNWIHFEVSCKTCSQCITLCVCACLRTGTWCTQGRNLSAVEAVIDEIHRFNLDRSEGERIKVSVELEKHFVMDSAHGIYRTADLVSDATICLSLYLHGICLIAVTL